MKFYIISFVVFFILTNFISSKEKYAPQTWSSYQGFMFWDYAVEKCERIGMRLPTKLEFELARKAKITEAWSKDGRIYWAEEDFSTQDAFNQFVLLNPIYWTSEEISEMDAFVFHSQFESFQKNYKFSRAHVRCISTKKQKPNNKK